MALGHPFVSPIVNQVPGVPIGINIVSKERVRFHPWELKQRGIMLTSFGTVLGDVGTGKSSLLKLIAFRLMMLSAGYDMLRVAINDYKPEGKDSEYESLTRVARSKVFHMGSMGVNPFARELFITEDGTLYELGLLDVAQAICEFSKENSLTGEEHTALRVGIMLMLEMDVLFRSPHSLEKALRSMTDADIVAYFGNLDGRLRNQLTKRMESVKDAEIKGMFTQQIEKMVTRPDTFEPGVVRRAAHKVATYLSTVLYGSYANMFGDSHSLYDMYTQRVVTKDWRNVREDAEKLMRIIDTTIKITAVENNRIDLLPHLEIDDEKHKSMDNLVYARSNAYMSEIARSTHICNMSATHRLDSIRKGDVNGELYRLGQTIINNQGFVFLGKQKNDPVALNELRDRYRLTYEQRNMLPIMPPWHFIMVLGDTDKPQVMRTFVTPLELAAMQTNEATYRMNRRPDPQSDANMREFARLNGLEYTYDPSLEAVSYV